MRSVALVAAGLAAAVGLSGCGGTKAATPVPEVTSQIGVPSSDTTISAQPSAGPSATAAPTVTVVPGKDPHYAEAVAVYRRYLDELHAIELAGGASRLPAVFEALSADPLLSLTTELVQADARAGVHLASSPGLKVMFLPGTSKASGSLVDIRACTDARAIHVLDSRQHPVGYGNLALVEVQFRRQGGALKAYDSEVIEAKSCPRN